MNAKEILSKVRESSFAGSRLALAKKYSRSRENGCYPKKKKLLQRRAKRNGAWSNTRLYAIVSHWVEINVYPAEKRLSGWMEKRAVRLWPIPSVISNSKRWISELDKIYGNRNCLFLKKTKGSCLIGKLAGLKQIAKKIYTSKVEVCIQLNCIHWETN